MKPSKKAIKAMLSLAIEAMTADGSNELTETIAMIERVTRHPFFAGMPYDAFQAISGEAAQDLERAGLGKGVETFAPRVPAALAETALELAMWASVADGVFQARWEAGYLERLRKALGVPEERSLAIWNGVLDALNTGGGGVVVQE